MSNTVIKVLSIALDEKGYLEKKNLLNLDSKVANAGRGNYTKYWRDLKPSWQGQPWCQCFINWIFKTAFGTDTAKKLLCQNEWSYYTPDCAEAFKKADRWHTKEPEVGDIVYFKNSERIHHVGIVISVSGNTITTIEGNTSSAVGVVPNGGGVFEKHYNFPNSVIAGFGRPEYDKGAYTIGWHLDNDGWWYADTEATYLAGQWKDINHARYYFNEEGYAVKGEQYIDSKRYYFEPTTGAEKECALMVTNENNELVIYETE